MKKNSFCTADYFDQMQKNGTPNTWLGQMIHPKNKSVFDAFFEGEKNILVCG